MNKAEVDFQNSYENRSLRDFQWWMIGISSFREDDFELNGVMASSILSKIEKFSDPKILKIRTYCELIAENVSNNKVLTQKIKTMLFEKDQDSLRSK